MVRQAEESRLILQVGHIYRYHPASSKIKQIIEEGRLGTLEYAYGHFMGFKRPRMDVGVTQTDAIHYFDLFNYLFDRPPQAVTAVIKKYLSLRLDDTSISVLDFQGRIVFIEAGYMPPEKRRDIAIIGDRASLYCDFQKNSLLFCDNHHERKGEKCVAIEGEAQGISIDDDEPLKTELEAFLYSMRHRSEPLANGRAGYEALRIVEACYESSQRGKRIEIDWKES
jgi:predicted dehydrogenase